MPAFGRPDQKKPAVWRRNGLKSPEIRLARHLQTAAGMKKFVRAVWLSLAVVCGARADVPAATNAIPFEFSDGLLWLRVEAPQAGRTLNFLLDTGAERSVLNAATAKELGLAGARKISVQGVEAETTGEWPVRCAAKAGNLALPAEYLALDLSQLARSCDRPLDGLLGADFLRGKVMKIDFAAGQLLFCQNISPAKTDTVLPLKTFNDCFCLPVSINGRSRQWLRLDTGCATPLQWVTTRAVAGAKPEKPAIGLAPLAIPQAKTTVALGGNQFTDVPTGIHRRAIFAGESGLVGNGLLSRFAAVTLDAKSGRLILTPL